MKIVSHKFFCLRRKFVVLIEVIIAMALMMIVMTMLLGFYSQISFINQQQEIEQKKNFQKLYLSTRLAAVIPKAVSFSDSNHDSFFFTSNSLENMSQGAPLSLVFSYDNGIKLDPIFSNHCIGRLYVNEKSELCLASWPSPLRWKDGESPPMQKEILLEGVVGMNFRFYVPPAGERSVILMNFKKKFQPSPDFKLDMVGQWRKEWLQEWGDLPVLVKIDLELKDATTIPLVYYLPQSHLFIFYQS